LISAKSPATTAIPTSVPIESKYFVLLFQISLKGKGRASFGNPAFGRREEIAVYSPFKTCDNSGD
jgi:hypothetical protein